MVLWSRGSPHLVVLDVVVAVAAAAVAVIIIVIIIIITIIIPIFRENFADGSDMGGAFAVYHKGNLVCDLWGGYQDDDASYPWQPNTMSIFFSATKGVTAICLLMLADR